MSVRRQVSAAPAPYWPRRFAVFAVLAALAALLAASPRSMAAEEGEITAPEDSWISVTGTAVATARGRFRLDHGGDETPVMIDSKRYMKERDRIDNRTVTVYGRLDRDFFDRERLEAAAVFVHDLDLAFYADGVSEEGVRRSLSQPQDGPAPEPGMIGISGRVAATRDDGLTLRAGGREFKVDTSGVADRSAVKEVGRGDMILVYGKLGESRLFDNPAIRARSMTVLKQGADAR